MASGNVKLTLLGSTVSGNNANRDGSGIFTSGSGLFLANATIANNQADADFNGSGIGGGVANAGSPAIDAGNVVRCNDNVGGPLTTDQRGFVRPDQPGHRCDIGAFE